MNILYYTRQILININEVEDNKSILFEKTNEIKFRKANKIKKIFSIVMLFVFVFFTICNINSMLLDINCAHVASSFFRSFFESIGIVLDFLIKTLILLVLFLLISCIVKIIISHVTSKFDLSEDDNSKINTLNYEIDNLNSEKNRLLNELSCSWIPMDYKNLDALNFMIKAYENKQGDTFKELVNLYENYIISNKIQTEFKDELKRTQNSYEKEINRLNKDLKKVKKDLNKTESSITLMNLSNLLK